MYLNKFGVIFLNLTEFYAKIESKNCLNLGKLNLFSRNFENFLRKFSALGKFSFFNQILGNFLKFYQNLPSLKKLRNFVNCKLLSHNFLQIFDAFQVILIIFYLISRYNSKFDLILGNLLNLSIIFFSFSVFLHNFISSLKIVVMLSNFVKL